jgi:hypothetical protein
MTPQQQSANQAAQIRFDCVRRNQTTALLQSSLSNQALIGVIQAGDTAATAIGQSIPYTEEAKFAAGMIDGTAGLTISTVPYPVALKVPPHIAPTSKIYG